MAEELKAMSEPTDGLIFDWRTWGCFARPKPRDLDNYGAEREPAPVRRESASGGTLNYLPNARGEDGWLGPSHNIPVDADAVEAQERGGRIAVLNSSPQSLKQKATQATPLSLKPKATQAKPLRCQTLQIWVAALRVLSALALGYTVGLDRVDYLAAWVETNASPGVWLVTEHGQATPLATALLLGAVLLAPIVLTSAGSRVALVLTAATPTAFVWLLPIAAKLGFANSLATLNSHDEADIIGVITTPQATGWMVALFSFPLVALLRIANVGGRGPQYSSRLRTTGVTTVVLFYLWLLSGAWMRAPVRYSFPAHGETMEENMDYLRNVGRPIPPRAEFSIAPPYATFTLPFRHPEHPGARYVDLVIFALMMLSLASHAATHRTSKRLGRGGALLCVWLPCLSALVTVTFGAYSCFRAETEWGARTLLHALPIAVAQVVGLTGLAFLPLLHSPESDLIYNIELVRKSYVNKLSPGRSLVSPFVAVVTFVTLPEVFRRFSFLANSDIHVDSRIDLSDPDILGAPCSAVTGTASLSSYIDSPFYAALLGLVFFFPLLDVSASSQRTSNCSKLDAALSQSLCFALALFVVRVSASPSRFTPHVPSLLLPTAGFPPFLRCGAAPEHRGVRFLSRSFKGPHPMLHWAQAT